MSEITYVLQPRWLSVEDASKYSSLSRAHLYVLVQKKLVSSRNVRMPEATRGRRVIDRLSLDSYIENSGDEASECCQISKKKGSSK